MNRGQLRTLCRKGLGDSASAFWTDAELNTLITNGFNDISFRTKCIRDNGYLTSVDCTQNTSSAASNEYTLSTNFTNIYSLDEVYFMDDGERWVRLEPTTRGELDVDEPGWRMAVGRTYTDPGTGTVYYNYQSTPGTPTKYYWDREEDVFGLHLPPDSDNSGGDYIRIYYTKKHTAMTDDNDIPDVPEPLHLACIDFVKATGFEQRGWGERANDAWDKYFGRLSSYFAEKEREKEDENIFMRSYQNIRGPYA